MIACIEPATRDHWFADGLDCSSFVGTPVKRGDEVVGVVLRAWVKDGSLYADLDVAGEISDQIRGDF